MAATMTMPQVESVGTDDEDEIDHIYCCDENIAMCGVDLTGVAEVGPDSKNPVCPLCKLAEESDQGCLVCRGCEG